MALDSVPTYLSDLGSAHRAARTQQQRIRYAEAQLPQVSPAAKFARISVSWCLFFNFCSVKKHQERWAHLDLGHLRSVWRRAPVEEVRREEALQLPLPKVHNPSCLQSPFHAFCSLKKRFFFFQSKHASTLCARTSVTVVTIQLSQMVNSAIARSGVNLWDLLLCELTSDYLKYLDFRNTSALFWLEIFLVFNRFIVASSNINKGDSYMLPIYFLNVASRPHHVIKLQFLHYLK